MNLSNVSAQQLWNDFLIQTHRIQITPVLPLVTSLYLGISSEVNEPLSARGSNQWSSGSDVTAEAGHTLLLGRTLGFPRACCVTRHSPCPSLL